MNRLDEVFKQKKKCITFYLTLGYPNETAFFDLTRLLVENGMDVLEVGIPVANPFLDGKTVADTHARVLDQGFDQPMCDHLLRKLRNRYPELPIVIMSYYEGIDNFQLRDKADLFDALLCPDRAVNGMDHIIEIYNETMSLDEIKEKLKCNQHFAYVMSGNIPTGSSKEPSTMFLETIAQLHTLTALPVQIGFGISTPSHVERVVAENVNGVIIGSELIRRFDNKPYPELLSYVQNMCQAAHS